MYFHKKSFGTLKKLNKNIYTVKIDMLNLIDKSKAP